MENGNNKFFEKDNNFDKDISTILRIENEIKELNKNLDNEKKQNDLSISSCEDIIKSLNIALAIRAISYNGKKAEDATNYPDVADPNDKEKAIANINSGKEILTNSKKDLEVIITVLNKVNSVNLADKISEMKSVIGNNVESCGKWISIANDCINGKFDNLHNADKKENKFIVDQPETKDGIVEPIENKNEQPLDTEKEISAPISEEPLQTIEPTDLIADEVENKVDNLDNAEKVVATEEYKEPVLEPTIEPAIIPNTISTDSIDELSKQLDDEMQPVKNDINDMKNMVNDAPVVNTELPFNFDDFNIASDEKVSSLEENNVNTDNENKVEESQPTNTTTITSATSVDEGPVKVDKIEELVKDNIKNETTEQNNVTEFPVNNQNENNVYDFDNGFEKILSKN